MYKVAFVFPCFLFSTLALEPLQRHVEHSPHSASDFYFTRTERQVLAPAAALPASIAVPVASVASPLSFPRAPAVATSSSALPSVSAGSLALPASAAVAIPAPVVEPVSIRVSAAPVPAVTSAPVVAKVALSKLSYPQYAYGYSVQDFSTGDNKVAKEVREGSIVRGSYSVADPDGTKRTVNYYADPVHGFNAVVHKTQILK